MKIISISFFSVLALAALIFMARIWGIGQNHLPYNHDFFNGPHPALIIKAENDEQIQSLTSKSPDYIIWLDVRLSFDKVPFIMNPVNDKKFLDDVKERQYANPQERIMIGNKLSEYPLDQIEKFYGVRPKLADIYAKYPTTKFLLNVVDNTHEVHAVLNKTLEPHKSFKRTMIQSEALIVMTSLKELRPEYVYGTSIPDLMRFLSMDSMWILPSTQFKGDVFVSPFKIYNRPAFNDDIIAEAKRRHKKVYLGPITTEEELQRAKNLGADAYIINNLEEYLKLPNQGPAL